MRAVEEETSGKDIEMKIRARGDATPSFARRSSARAAAVNDETLAGNLTSETDARASFGNARARRRFATAGGGVLRAFACTGTLIMYEIAAGAVDVMVVEACVGSVARARGSATQ